MKKIITTLLLFVSIFAFAQGGALADLKFEEAEIAFNNQDYETTIKKLDEFDKLLGSIKDKSLYLRIISQDKLFEKLFLTARIGVQSTNNEKGMQITNVFENSAAFKADLKINDIILKLNELKISNNVEFTENVKYKKEGDQLTIQLLRGEELIDKTLFVELSKDVKDENKIYFDDKNFDFLTKFRKNTNAYLKAMESSGLDERYREVYAIHEKLVKYPIEKTTWLKEKQKLVNDINNKIKEEKIKLEEFKKKDTERGIKIQNYEFDSGLIALNRTYAEITTNRKGNLKQNENIPNYKYLRHNYSFSGLNPKNGLPEISEILLNKEDKVSGYCLLFLDANKNKRNKLECDGIYSSIKEKLNLDSGIEWKELNEKVSYTDNSVIHTFFYFSTSKNSNNTLLLAYIFREFPNTPKNNTARIEYYKLPFSSDKLNSNKIRYISDSPGYNGYNQIYELLK